jgi:hypothetical protein
MHSTLVRLQNVFGFFTTVAFVVAALIAASDLAAPRTPKSTIQVKDISVYVPYQTFNSPAKPSITNTSPALKDVHTTTPPKPKNTHKSDSPSPQISPRSSHGIPNKFSSTCRHHGLIVLQWLFQMRLLSGTRSSRILLRTT